MFLMLKGPLSLTLAELDVICSIVVVDVKIGLV